MKTRLWLPAMLLLCISCRNVQEQQIDYTLELSGENRTQLEEVLGHYRRDEADSLKLRAAEYLIAHMPGHYSYAGKAVVGSHWAARQPKNWC